ncbi:YncE family protein [Streptomyces sp. NBC_01754]|uniref:YncE family protein n=1 Tax=Streptomyces sp. NBC_01754 TaxID=2975930 RepID=UPI002DDAF316|nr:YncE family protein [Streptomyces sp. NBC_01754]WSC96226.1 YncE family protein [Streptomyces sp. NBC_01754]
MTSIPSSRRTVTRAAIAVAVMAGTTAGLTGTSFAHSAPRDTVTVAPLANGLYQSSFSERNNVLWATSAVGRPPVVSSGLLKVDPKTLKVKQTITPPVTDADTGALEAVYGVAVDDEHNTVWTTNSRDDSVAVYDQRTGKHLATLPNVKHAREVVVDERHNTVWASAFTDGTLVAFDSKTFKEKKRITVADSGPTGLTVNEKTGTVYAADLNGDQIIEITTKSKSPRLIPVAGGPISIALSKDGKTAYTADQNAGGVSVVDLKKGRVAKSVTTGEGALSVAADHRSGNLVVANRTAGTVSVVNPKTGKVVRTVTTGANPNHVEIVGGTAYVVDKSGAGVDGKDQIHRFSVSG